MNESTKQTIREAIETLDLSLKIEAALNNYTSDKGILSTITPEVWVQKMRDTREQLAALIAEKQVIQ